MSTRLTTGLLACLMASFLVGCASQESLIRGQSPAYPMPAGANSGHGFGAYSQGVPFPFNGLLGKSTKSSVQSHVNAYYGIHGTPAYGSGGYPVSTNYSGAYAGGGAYSGAACESSATCENGYCQDPSCRPGGYCHQGHCLWGNCCLHGNDCCPHCNGQGCPHCRGTGHGYGGEQWAPTHLYAHKYQIPQGMVYPQNPTAGAITVYPYYTHKGPDDFFYPPLKK